MNQDGYFDGANGTKLYYRSWRPQRGPRAMVVVVHGWKAHTGMYEWPAQQLIEQGLAVHAADLRGHGKSQGERYHVDKFDDYVTDLTKFVDLVRTKEGATLPLFILGHSAGGVIGSLYVLINQKSLAGFICEDFAYEIPPPEAALALLKGVAHLAPHAHLLNLKDEDFSRDQTFVDRMKKDPLAINTPGTVQLLAELIRADERLKAAFPRMTLPLLIMHGTADRVAKAHGSQFFYDAASSKDKTFKLYEGHYHDLLNDLGKEQVMADVLTWLNKHIQLQAVASV